MTEHRIRALEDLLELDDDQFMRLLPDLVLWHRRSRLYLQTMAAKFKEAGETMPKHEAGFDWVDDGAPAFLGFEINVNGQVIRSKPDSASQYPPEQAEPT